MIEGLYFITGLALTVLTIPLVKRISFNIGYLDSPGRDPLKIHALPIPHSGGIAIFGVFSLLLLFVSLFGNLEARGLELAGLLLAGATAFSLGVWVDLKSTNPMIRLGIQALAGLVLVIFGHRIQAPFFISLPLTLFYVVGAINSINMEDGLDGLAGGMAALTCLGFATLSVATGQSVNLLISVILCGVVFGFLCYNFYPATIFMGDNGSYLVGLMVAYHAVSFTDMDHWSTFLAPIFIVGVPVFDVAYAILRRMKKGVSPFVGDRSHFYDQLMQKGLTVRQTVLICWSIQAILVGCGNLIYLLG